MSMVAYQKNLLNGIKILELAGLAPSSFCGLVLADFGAEVTVIQKVYNKSNFEERLIRNKNVISVNLKTAEGLQSVKELCRISDVLIDPYRPGVLEKIGLDPVELMKDNRRLVVIRITGYGQVGEMASAAGHDINYVGLSGILPMIAGRSNKQAPYWTPANLLGDFAGGSFLAAFAIVSALHHRDKTGLDRKFSGEYEDL